MSPDSSSSMGSRSRHEAETLPPSDKGPLSSTRVNLQETIAPTGARPAAPTATAEVKSVKDFVDCLSLSGLLTNDELNTFTSEFTVEGNENIQAFVDALIKKKKLTTYQADQLRQGQTRGLVFGNYTVLDKLGEG